MPEKHLKYLEEKQWDADYFIKQASQIGENTAWAMAVILAAKSLIEQTYKSCLGVLRLAKKYSPERLERACSKAKTTKKVTYGILKNILKNNMDKAPDPQQEDAFHIPEHNNIRGAKNYN